MLAGFFFREPCHILIIQKGLIKNNITRILYRATHCRLALIRPRNRVSPTTANVFETTREDRESFILQTTRRVLFVESRLRQSHLWPSHTFKTCSAYGQNRSTTQSLSRPFHSSSRLYSNVMK